MPLTRYIEEYDNKGNVINRIPFEVSDEQLADEAESAALSKAEELIDAINNLGAARVFLKRLVKRLIKKGVLP